MALLIFIFLFLGVSGEQVKVTVYHIEGLTASGDHTNQIPEKFIAVSRDLLPQYPMNTYVELTNCEFEGVYIIKDLMAKRWTKKIDVYMSYTGKKYNPCICEISRYETPVDSL